MCVWIAALRQVSRTYPKTFIMKRSHSALEKRFILKLEQVSYEVSLEHPIVLKTTANK